jgi:hypothetical protein
LGKGRLYLKIKSPYESQNKLWQEIWLLAHEKDCYCGKHIMIQGNPRNMLTGAT